MKRIPERRRPIGGASNAEINRELALLKRMFTLAMQAAKLLYRPHIPMLKENNVRTGFFEREQFESVLAHLPVDSQPVIAFAYITGWRITSEVLPLKWRQVDFDAGEIRRRTLVLVNEHRRRLIAHVQRIFEAEGEDRRFEDAWPHVFRHRMVDPNLVGRAQWRKIARHDAAIITAVASGQPYPGHAPA